MNDNLHEGKNIYCGVLDIGYHYSTGPLNPPSQPEDLDITGVTLSWSHPSGSTPAYLVMVELPGGDLMDFYWTSGTSYTIPQDLRSYNLWCGVMSHLFQVTYSDPVWIEYY